MTTHARPSPGGRRLEMVAAVAALALALASCSGSGFRYIKDSSSTAFFKLPEAWRLYDENAILDSDVIHISPQMKQAVSQAVWMVAFDSGSSPSLSRVVSFDTSEPVGFAQVRSLGAQERDSFSLSNIRNAVFQVDGNATTGTSQAEVLISEDVVMPGGYHGMHIEYNVQNGQDFVTVDQIGVVDPATTTLYLFAIGCEAHCFLDNQHTIDDIAGSWTVKEPS